MRKIFYLLIVMTLLTNFAGAKDMEVAVITTQFGDIVIEFFEEEAPNHVKNFKKLATTGFYDGCTFHRVIPGFMIQGGDPNSKDDDRSNDGTGGPGYTIDAEFSKIHHDRGILSMARAMDPNSAGSQFFVVVKDSRFLDNKYTVFGKVIEGMEIADEIVGVSCDAKDNPYKRVEMNVKITSLQEYLDAQKGE